MKRRDLLAAALLLLPQVGRAADRRIVVVGGALTEIAFALGQGESVVAVDSTSFFPMRAAELPRIGYMRALPPEGILSLRPDLLVLSSEAGPPAPLSVVCCQSIQRSASKRSRGSSGHSVPAPWRAHR